MGKLPVALDCYALDLLALAGWESIGQRLDRILAGSSALRQIEAAGFTVPEPLAPDLTAEIAELESPSPGYLALHATALRKYLTPVYDLGIQDESGAQSYEPASVPGWDGPTVRSE